MSPGRPDSDDEKRIPLEQTSGPADVAFFEEEARRPNGSYPLSTHDARRLSPLDRLTILRRRQDELASYLKDALPDAVVKSEFFLAPDDQGRYSVYEIQERIVNAKEMRSFDQETADRIPITKKHELQAEFARLAEKIDYLKHDTAHPFYKRFYPDLSIRNILVTADGHLKIVDTNICHPKTPESPLYDTLSYTMLQAELCRERLENPAKRLFNKIMNIF
jgi:hypothetical protein